MNVASRLVHFAQSCPHTLAVASPLNRDSRGRLAYTHLTFRELESQSTQLAHGLRNIGLEIGSRAALMVTPGLDFFTLTFALLRSGIIPVMIDPGMGLRQFGRCLDDAAPQAIIGVPKAHAARLVFGWAKQTLLYTITTGSRRWGAQFTLEDVARRGVDLSSETLPALSASDTAAILFTSGSTGIAKGVVYSHGVLAAQVESLRLMYAIEPGEIDLCTFPLFALFAPALGMTAVVPEMDPTRPASVNPSRIIEAIKHWGVTNLFGSPALLNRVGRYAVDHRISLPTIKRVVSAGAPVPTIVVSRFASLLSPPAQVHTPYGATEALPVSTIGSDDILSETGHATEQGAGVCVGRPVKGIEVRILPVHDQIIESWNDTLPVTEPSQVGEIAVFGSTVTSTYDNRIDATRLAKISDPSRGGVWHRMGDLGYLDSHGRLWVCGRKAHRVMTTSGPLDSLPVEEVFNKHPDVYRTALVGVSRRGHIEPVLCVELERLSRRRSRTMITQELLEIGAQYPHTAQIHFILYHRAFPVDVRHNAKIFRERLAIWAARQLR